MPKRGRSKNAREKVTSNAAAENDSEAGPQKDTENAATQKGPDSGLEPGPSADDPEAATDEAKAHDSEVNIDENAVAQVLALNGWSLETLRGGYWLCNVHTPAKIASPFADMGGRAAELMETLTTEVPIGVRILYEEFRDHMSELKSELLGGKAISESGRTGHLGVLQQIDPGSLFEEEDDEQDEDDEDITDKSLLPEVLPWGSDCKYCDLSLYVESSRLQPSDFA